ncbi:hypothetical protein [Actinophytocola sediminis]
MPPPESRQKKRRWPWVIVGLFAVIVVLAVARNPSTEDTTESAPANETETPAGPATTVTSGTYEVGADIQPGQYKTPGPPEGDVIGTCYWARLTDDSGALKSIIANANLEGPGSVTINPGEFFEASGECIWTRVR